LCFLKKIKNYWYLKKKDNFYIRTKILKFMKKTKKITVLFVMLIACMFSFYYAYSSTSSICVVSSNSDNNIGHCRERADGTGDGCFTSGSGPACAYTQIIKSIGG
jgi:hypothetical protein